MYPKADFFRLDLYVTLVMSYRPSYWDDSVAEDWDTIGNWDSVAEPGWRWRSELTGKSVALELLGRGQADTSGYVFCMAHGRQCSHTSADQHVHSKNHEAGIHRSKVCRVAVAIAKHVTQHER